MINKNNKDTMRMMYDCISKYRDMLKVFDLLTSNGKSVIALSLEVRSRVLSLLDDAVHELMPLAGVELGSTVAFPKEGERVISEVFDELLKIDSSKDTYIFYKSLMVVLSGHYLSSGFSDGFFTLLIYKWSNSTKVEFDDNDMDANYAFMSSNNIEISDILENLQTTLNEDILKKLLTTAESFSTFEMIVDKRIEQIISVLNLSFPEGVAKNAVISLLAITSMTMRCMGALTVKLLDKLNARIKGGNYEARA